MCGEFELLPRVEGKILLKIIEKSLKARARMNKHNMIQKAIEIKILFVKFHNRTSYKNNFFSSRSEICEKRRIELRLNFVFWLSAKRNHHLMMF